MKHQLSLLLIALLSFAAPVGCKYDINVIEDKDGDGVPDSEDVCPDDPGISKDEGECGCHYRKTDRGCVYRQLLEPPNPYESCPEGSKKASPGFCGCDTPDTDTDDDTIPDCFDDCPKDPDKISPGICGCGIPDTDSDNDNTPDCLDICDDDPDKILPGICGCGITDNDDDNDAAFFCGEEHPKTTDFCPDDPNKQKPGYCGCGIPDDDKDNDGALFCGEDHPKTTDRCPDDPNKQDPGTCGCGKPDIDSDGDDTLDCNDECPYDYYRQTNDLCGCNSSGHVKMINTVDGESETHCVEEGGVLQAGGIKGGYPNTHAAMIYAFHNRTVSSTTITLTYAPAGNLLYNPALEYDDNGWEITSYERHYTGCFGDNDMRPFGNYPCLRSSYFGSTFSQKIDFTNIQKYLKDITCTESTENPSYIACKQKLTLAVFAISQCECRQPHIPCIEQCVEKQADGSLIEYYDSVQIGLCTPSDDKEDCDFSGTKTEIETGTFELTPTKIQPQDSSPFRLFTYSNEIDLTTLSNPDIFIKAIFTGSDGYWWSGYYGAGLQYFAAYLGKRKIRFSNDGENWTDWEEFSPSSNDASFGFSDAWYKIEWPLTEYGGNAESGLKTVYMQTHDLLTDRYYETSSTFTYAPTSSGE